MTAAPVAATGTWLALVTRAAFPRKVLTTASNFLIIRESLLMAQANTQVGICMRGFLATAFRFHFATCCSANPGLEDCELNAVSPRASSVLLLLVGEGQRESSAEEAMMI